MSINYRVSYDSYGNKESEAWFKNDKFHRDNDLPAAIQYFSNGLIRSEEWFKNSRLHRDGDKPAFIVYYYNGNIIYYKYYKFGHLHRENDKPALIEYYLNGNIKNEMWFTISNKIRSYDLPSEISYYENGNKLSESWHFNHIFFRLKLSDNYLPQSSSIRYDEINNIINRTNHYFDEVYGEFYNMNETKHIKLVYLLKKFINKYKNRKRFDLLQLLHKTNLNLNGKDVSNLITKFIYY